MTENSKDLVEEKVYIPHRRGGGHYTTRTTVEWHQKYFYTVDAHEYLGTRIAFYGNQPGDELAIEQLHGDVQVFYDPSHPSRSVLLPGVRGSVWPEMVILLAGLAFGLVLTFCGVALLECWLWLPKIYKARRTALS